MRRDREGYILHTEGKSQLHDNTILNMYAPKTDDWAS